MWSRLLPLVGYVFIISTALVGAYVLVLGGIVALYHWALKSLDGR